MALRPKQYLFCIVSAVIICCCLLFSNFMCMTEIEWYQKYTSEPLLLEDRFTNVPQTSISTFSAYFDGRDARKGAVIKVLGIRNREEKGDIYCRVILPDGMPLCLKKPATVENMDPLNKENKDLEYFFICHMPTILKPIGVALYTSETCGENHPVLLVHYPEKESGTLKGEFGVCLSAPSYNIDGGHFGDLQENLEMNRILGASRIFFHNETMSASSEVNLKRYIDERFIDVTPWRPSDRQLHTFAQTLAINDCLYRHMYKYEYLVFTDVDEFIMPQDGTTWGEMMKQLADDSIAAYIFSNLYHYNETDESAKKRLVAMNIPNEELEIPLPRISKSILRSPKPDSIPNHSKYILNPVKVNSVTLHKVFDMLPGYKNYSVPSKIGMNHHLKQSKPGADIKELTTIFDPYLLQLFHTLRSFS